jgi:hypothetical protein
MSDVIGQWAARFIGELQRTRWHLVESEIAERLVTHCGRQMPQRNGNGYLLTDAAPSSGKCERCAR